MNSFSFFAWSMKKKIKNLCPISFVRFGKVYAVLKLLGCYLSESDNFIWSINFLNVPFNFILSPRK